ncbi:thiamine diphosphokinase [Terrilactibacillus sp. S3-3]|nr:thiamine diphosphokinase [Terrilactibacillus sp. S3-3]
MNRMAILAGGPEALQPPIESAEYDDCTWIGVDRGTYYLLRKGRVPARAFGDFDSLSETEKKWVFEQPLPSTYPREKDKTDLEIAIDWALAEQPDECLIFGATGGRLDHGLINIQLLLKGVGTGIRLRIIDKKKLSLCLLRAHTM